MDVRQNQDHELTPGGLRQVLVKLEQALTTGDTPLSELRQLAPPHQLHALFYLQLCTMIKTGPVDDTGRQATPNRLLSAAQQAAAAGVLPLSTPLTLRRVLEQLESRLHKAEAWDPAHPLWWSPLPPLHPLETLWNRLNWQCHGPLFFPSEEQLSAAFAGSPSGPLWLSLPSLLEPTFASSLHQDLERAHRNGSLRLERGGVGPSARVSSRRTDSVCYLSGREPELIQAAPSLAAFVQWGLCHLGDRLKTVIPGKRVFPPQTAMVSRYLAPSDGYHPHVDNPGGRQDNGRTLTLVIYLNEPGREALGGELAVWAANAATTSPPTDILPARGGSAVLFDSRAIVHQVRRLSDGPARWALTFWFNDAPQQRRPWLPLPELTLTDVLLPVSAPPLPSDVVLFHELKDEDPAGEIVVRSVKPTRPRIGLVSTVYRAGLGLDAWCEHHVSLGADHIVLIFDHLEEPAEADDAARLSSTYSPNNLTIWSSAQLATERWRSLPEDRYLDELLRFARSGSSSYAVAARQTLNASVALRAAKGDELGGAPLDWLIHLDADELLYLEGAGRGGATLPDHFAAAEAAGLKLLRYVNHELLLPHQPGSPPRFKLNPRLAAARLGPRGWAEVVTHLGMSQSDPRPYFNGYLNGKSAVAVPAGVAAAGVHGWFLSRSCQPADKRFLAGPSILHFHYASPEAFGRKYLHIAASSVPSGPRLFEPSPAEVAALKLIRSLHEAEADGAVITRRLNQLHSILTTFSEDAVELLTEARLIMTPNLKHDPFGSRATRS